ncbi:putative DsbA family dithiol-disulfide isomerase [Maribacter vaceletii]|uniref:Putative DsbA family dithiol-disulfide isomerase n=1 Tax=Maribacter vaceletii TaxID=1206816 RepID=A0A495EDE2_9FLAO|nr:DsbA family oxidoreductase [Maribacter vaceletii]RKR14639.1 putative DsbA family dithiol-disulfide isomerase [Maribacter vaceletii]
MKVSIWSDIRCPFCYIGKRKFEAALENFPHKEEIIVEWKSFELDPHLETQPNVDYTEFFMEVKNVDKDTALSMFDRVNAMAKDVGLNFNVEKAITANSLNAHRLIHFAKKYNAADIVKETLLKAHLEDAKNIDAIDVLVQIANEVGLDSDKVKNMLVSEDFTYEVRQDELEARNLGINGVPFFVLDGKYGISGAQPESIFTEALENAWKKHKQEKLTILNTGEGSACDVDGNCD